MCHFQEMLAPVLTAKRSGPVTLSKHMFTRRKGNQGIVNDYALPVSQMLWNCLEDSRKFYSLAVNIKTGPITGEERNFPTDRLEQFLAQGLESGFLPAEFERDRPQRQLNINQTLCMFLQSFRIYLLNSISWYVPKIANFHLCLLFVPV